jgi:hypothetical protein
VKRVREDIHYDDDTCAESGEYEGWAKNCQKQECHVTLGGWDFQVCGDFPLQICYYPFVLCHNNDSVLYINVLSHYPWQIQIHSPLRNISLRVCEFMRRDEVAQDMMK